MNKRILALVLCLCLCAAVMTTASAAKVIKLNTSWGENSSVQKAALRFGELLSEQSGGAYEVRVYPSNQLASGNQQTAVEMVQSGDIEMSMFGMTVLSFLDDRLAVVNMPFLINSYDDADKYLFDKSAESRLALDSILAENGMVSVAFGEAGFRQITNSKHVIASPEDLKGLKIRVLSTCPMFFDLYGQGGLGADATAINMSEVFTALQQGVVDGQENAVDTAKSYRLNEVQDYLTCWNGVYDAVAFVASPVFWDQAGDDAAMIQACAEQAMQEQIASCRASVESILAEFAQTMTITELTDEQIAAFKTAVEPVYDLWFDKIGADLLAKFGYVR
ncbi:MAG: DctP family TRAP transporter solute-binding subunit [Clostridiales bacterium]|nr:DctP family TRAP transporter solute-binding subunit [Clostridiales bacterium]